MRIAVNSQNIIDYALHVVTGNSIQDLLARAADHTNRYGTPMYVTIPDVNGGDTEAPTERNAFEHYGGLPEPEATHAQHGVNLMEGPTAEYQANPCSYKLVWTEATGDIWVCTKHNQNSKYAVDRLSHAPCLEVDPYPES